MRVRPADTHQGSGVRPDGIGEFANDSEVRTNPTATVRLADGVRRIKMPGKPDAPDTASYITTLPEAKCFELLAVAIVGRVGFVSPTGLQIIPMNYRLGADHQLFMKTAPGSALAQLAEIDAEVVFEVDYHADDFRIAWSVLMNGTLGRLDAAATAAYNDLQRPPVPWPGPASSLPVRFVPRTVSGRGLHRTRQDWER
jgi:nitroimidazol reductase NimA-like FMN-containing flavoprotein (pyridoxamine 5'-phosphate oxidase superfamily)